MFAGCDADRELSGTAHREGRGGVALRRQDHAHRSLAGWRVYAPREGRGQALLRQARALRGRKQCPIPWHAAPGGRGNRTHGTVTVHLQAGRRGPVLPDGHGARLCPAQHPGKRHLQRGYAAHHGLGPERTRSLEIVILCRRAALGEAVPLSSGYQLDGDGRGEPAPPAGAPRRGESAQAGCGRRTGAAQRKAMEVPLRQGGNTVEHPMVRARRPPTQPSDIENMRIRDANRRAGEIQGRICHCGRGGAERR